VFFKSPLAFYELAEGDSPGDMAVGKQRGPGTDRASIALYKAQWANNRKHDALLDLDKHA
jgi:hypothetical protein